MNTVVKLAKSDSVGVAHVEQVGMSKVTNVGQTKVTNVGQTYLTKVGKVYKIEVGEEFTIEVGGSKDTPPKARLMMNKDGIVTIDGVMFIFRASGPFQLIGKPVHQN